MMLSSCNVPGSMLGARDAVINKTDKISVLNVHIFVPLRMNIYIAFSFSLLKHFFKELILFHLHLLIS